jgi:predicted RNA-binding protein with RPS1 domain
MTGTSVFAQQWKTPGFIKFIFDVLSENREVTNQVFTLQKTENGMSLFIHNVQVGV